MKPTLAPIPNDDELLRLDRAATAVFGRDAGVTGRTLARAARAGELVTYLVARKRFTTPANVRTWAQSKRSPSHPQPPTSADDGRAACARANAAIEALGGRGHDHRAHDHGDRRAGRARRMV